MTDKKNPAWHYGPKGEAQIFHDGETVPAGWHDHPSKHITPEKTGSKPLQADVDKITPAQRGAAPVVAQNDAPATQTGGAGITTQTADVSNTLDAEGWPWTAELHAGTKVQTKAGLWRMKVGATRPDPKPGYPKPALDL